MLAVLMLTGSLFASDPTYLPEFKTHLTDVATKNVKKEVMFSSMLRSIDLEHSICANRAHLWAYDFFRHYGVMSGKIFIFFGKSIWQDDKESWMYHVAPYIIENGKEFVMEASYGDVTRPLTVSEWIENETYNRVRGDECVVLSSQDTDMTEYFYERASLPETRENGKASARCYIRKVPGFYWFPTSIALHELGRDEDGRKVEYNPTSFDVDDVFSACVEVASSKFGRLFGGGKAKCRKHLER